MYSITYILDGQTITGTYDNVSDYLEASTWLTECQAEIIDGGPADPPSDSEGYR